MLALLYVNLGLSNMVFFSNMVHLIFAYKVFLHGFVKVCLLFSKIYFSKNYFMNTIRNSNCLDSEQDRLSVGPDLGPNCLQWLSADYKKN